MQYHCYPIKLFIFFSIYFKDYCELIGVEVGIPELMEEKCNCGPDELVLLIEFFIFIF